MLFWICCLGLMLLLIASPKNSKKSIQQEYDDLLKENLRENQMTEEPVSKEAVVKFTIDHLEHKYGRRIINLIKK